MVVMAYAVCSPIQVTYLVSGFGDCSTDNSTVWTWDSYNYAKATAYNKSLSPGEVHVFTPSLDMTGSETATLTFSHVHRYCGSPSDELTLWVTSDFKGSFASSSWYQLTISAYADQTAWKPWIDVTVNVPVEYVGSNTVFALKYKWTSSSTGTWEVKNLKIVTECAGGEIASPVPLPELGDGRIRVFAQNLRNYYWNYNNEQSTRANYDHEAFAKKTRQIVDAMMMTKADIFAFCELEASPQVLVQLADSVNKRVEDAPFVAVVDGIDVPWDSYDNNLKSGFIYRKDKVKPYGSNIAATTANYYKNTQRIQAFEELATKERFTLAMNHFKAKDSSEDQGNATRVMNANNLLNALNKSAVDPDILILGDFNCLKGEEPITILENAGYVEQLLKYEPQAFSHCYNWEGELIDHAFANASMSEYITGAGVFHICTSCGVCSNSAYRYSDHDAYLVAFNLPEKTECEDLDETYLTSKLAPLTSENGIWYWYNSGSYAKASKSGGYTDYMLTPEMDLTEMSAVSLSFKHAHKFAGTPSEELTLWVTADYQGSYATSSWQQLTISPYTNNTSWNFADVTINVPVEYVGSNTVFAFKYMSTASNYGTWEIKNLHITATCKGTGTGMEETRSMQPAQKTIEKGQLLITLPDGSVFNGFGIRIR
jgi:hypothetical protein